MSPVRKIQHHRERQHRQRYRALKVNTTGFQNTAFGANALASNTTGINNLAIGKSAGFNNPANATNNIDIGSIGNFADNGVIRIGTPGVLQGQTSFYAAGISGAGVSGASVIVNVNGQLGIALSSRRFKEDIQDMGDASSALLRLRPVTFRYKKAYEDGVKPIDYGLIAEEVADVYPDLVVKDADGQIETVQYQKLTPTLLTEMQKQNARIQLQQEQNRKLEDRIAALEALLSSQTSTSVKAVHSQ